MMTSWISYCVLSRRGDYVLRERKDVLRVFVYAPSWGICRAGTKG